MPSTLEKLGSECLKIQVSMASDLASKLHHRVYLYTTSKFFETPPFDVVIYNGVRTHLKEGKTSLLSSSAQSIVCTTSEYRSLIPQNRISEDSTGVYINP